MSHLIENRSNISVSETAKFLFCNFVVSLLFFFWLIKPVASCAHAPQATAWRYISLNFCKLSNAMCPLFQEKKHGWYLYYPFHERTQWHLPKCHVRGSSPYLEKLNIIVRKCRRTCVMLCKGDGKWPYIGNLGGVLPHVLQKLGWMSLCSSYRLHIWSQWTFDSSVFMWRTIFSTENRVIIPIFKIRIYVKRTTENILFRVHQLTEFMQFRIAVKHSDLPM